MKYAQEPQDALRAGAVAVVTTVAIGLLLFTLHKTIYRHRYTYPVPIWIIAVTGLLAGTILSVGIGWGSAWLSGSASQSWWLQITANSILMIWWGVTLSLVLHDRDDFSRRRNEAIMSALELELVKVRGSETEARLRSSLNRQIAVEIDQARSALSAALQTPVKDVSDPRWQPVAQLMRTIAQDVLRPLSRELWDSAGQVFPKPTLRQVVTTIVRDQPLRPTALSALVIILSAETLTKTFGSSIGLAVLAATVAFIYCALSLATLLMRRFPRQRPRLFGLTVLSFQAFDTGAWVLAGHWAQSPVPLETVMVNIVASAVLVLLTSGFGAYSAAGRQQLEAFARDLDREQMSILVSTKVVAELAMAASKTLHGRVQTRLLSCAAAIDRAVQTRDLDLLERALMEVDDAFESALIEPDDEHRPGLRQQLEQVAGRWTGICASVLEISSAVEHRVARDTLDVAAAVEEAITNAVRHGGATHVWVEVTVSDSRMHVVVTDDGSGPGGGAPGVGTDMLRMMSTGDVELSEVTGGGSRLRLTVPMVGY